MQTEADLTPHSTLPYRMVDGALKVDSPWSVGYQRSTNSPKQAPRNTYSEPVEIMIVKKNGNTCRKVDADIDPTVPLFVDHL